MVPAEQYLGDRHVTILSRARVLRVLKQARLTREGLVHGAHIVAEGAGKQPHDGVNEHEGGELAAREHEVAEREDVVGQGVDALVHALVSAADEQDATLM